MLRNCARSAVDTRGPYRASYSRTREVTWLRAWEADAVSEALSVEEAAGASTKPRANTSTAAMSRMTVGRVWRDVGSVSRVASWSRATCTASPSKSAASNP